MNTLSELRSTRNVAESWAKLGNGVRVDVDRLISRTLATGSIGGLLIAGFLVGHGMQDVLAGLGRCSTEADLFELVGTRLGALLEPEHCLVYARCDVLFEPRFARGVATPPPVEITSPLTTALAARHAPLAESRGSRRATDPMDPFDRAVLATFGAEAIVPVQREDRLVAFLCLGARSGDVYTPTDLTLLTALAQAVSGTLARLSGAELARRGQEAEERMRRYVPEAVAERVAAGRELEPERREVSVLFVDIRGYSSLCEGRAPEEIFAGLNRYTEAVSSLVRQHGGSIVEFNGDGMMAVFGAPEALANKERAAVEAARDIASAVGGISFVRDGPLLSVGVGIATGEAYVGNVRAADRLIWTALGNATNLAARLQALTRELGAVIVIDGATRRAAGASFVRHTGSCAMRATIPTIPAPGARATSTTRRRTSCG